MPIKYYDTCSLLKLKETIFNENFLISSISLEELENIKTSDRKDQETKFNARKLANLLNKNRDKYEVLIPNNKTYKILDKLQLKHTNDNVIIACAYQYMIDTKEDIEFISHDICVRLIACKKFDLNVPDMEEERYDDYKGYKEVKLNDEEMAYFYENLDKNTYNLFINEYIIIKDITGKEVDCYKWDGSTHSEITSKPFKSKLLGIIRPKDTIQRFAFDSIETNDITILYGKAGCGKTTLPLNYIIQGLENGNISKLYIVYSFEPLKNAKTLGFEKGTHTDKVLMSASIGNILSSKFGDMDIVRDKIEHGDIEIVPTANIRGVEFSEKSVVLVTECQNLDTYTLKTIMQRCKDGCKQIYEGDIHEQKDVNLSQVGMQRVIEVFKGYKKFGCIKLKNNYRSEIGELAERL